MAVCNQCSGAGGSHGGYDTCYRCGGSGHGGHTDVRCMACGGSGQADTRVFNTCMNCGGSGRVADAPTYGANTARKRSAKTGSNRTKTRAKGVTSQSGGGKIAWIIFLAGTLFGGFYLNDTYAYAEPWHPFALAAVPSAIVAAIWKILIWFAVIGVGILMYLGTGS